jgi:hypothetical protein
MTLNRRRVLFGTASLISLGILPGQLIAQNSEAIEVFKTATCGCCHDWIRYLQGAGFAVAAQDLEYDALAEFKQTAGVPDALVSCHTGRIAGYVIEGHVPAADIRRLLVERPAAIGLSVPGMPFGSPGMGPEDQRDAYDVILIEYDGAAAVFASYPKA